MPEDAAERDAFVPLVQAEIEAARDMWNEALAKLPAKGCYDIKVVFDARRAPRHTAAHEAARISQFAG